MTPNLVLLLATAALVLACPSRGTKKTTHYKGPDLRADRFEYSGNKQGPVWLRRAYKIVVGTARDPQNAKSLLEFHGAKTRYGQSGAVDEVAQVLVPAAAREPKVIAWLLVGKSARKRTKPVRVQLKSGAGVETIDPGQVCWEIAFSNVPPDSILELIASFEIPGTLVTDARPLGAPEAPTGELLLHYELPSDAVGSFAVVGRKDLEPIVSERDGHRVLGLMVKNVAASKKREPYARYITERANVSGYNQTFASSWARTVTAYVEEFVERSPTLRARSIVPYKPAAVEHDAIREIYHWVRQRIQRRDAMDAHWKSGRVLPEIMKENDLTAVDKVHILHWILEEAKLKHHMAMGRSNRFPPLDGEVPTPDAFDVPLVYAPGPDLWLDPGCQSCEAGEVRRELWGRQAILLPPGREALRTLPGRRAGF